MDFEFKRTKANRDGTFNYDVSGEFPVAFRDFYKQILSQIDAFEVEFRATNRCYGGWLGNRLEARKHMETWYWEVCSPKDWLEEIVARNVYSCVAHGNRNHMILYCTFESCESDTDLFVFPGDDHRSSNPIVI